VIPKPVPVYLSINQTSAVSLIPWKSLSSTRWVLWHLISDRGQKIWKLVI
jgi:hypothetical protein